LDFPEIVDKIPSPPSFEKEEEILENTPASISTVEQTPSKPSTPSKPPTPVVYIFENNLLNFQVEIESIMQHGSMAPSQESMSNELGIILEQAKNAIVAQCKGN
jgi:sensor domain CHASE-containing protein